MRWWKSLSKRIRRRFFIRRMAAHRQRRKMFLEPLENRSLLASTAQDDPRVATTIIDTLTSMPSGDAAETSTGAAGSSAAVSQKADSEQQQLKRPLVGWTPYGFWPSDAGICRAALSRALQVRAALVEFVD